MSDTEKTVRALEAERNIMLDRVREIGNAIALLQSLKLASQQDARKRGLGLKPFRMEDLKGVVLGNIPVKAIGRKPYVSKAKSKLKSGKRAYTKKSEFWAKPHPRKKK